MLRAIVWMLRAIVRMLRAVVWMLRAIVWMLRAIGGRYYGELERRPQAQQTASCKTSEIARTSVFPYLGAL